jgi:hypothetical protein
MVLGLSARLPRPDSWSSDVQGEEKSISAPEVGGRGRLKERERRWREEGRMLLLICLSPDVWTLHIEGQSSSTSSPHMPVSSGNTLTNTSKILYQFSRCPFIL